MLRKRVENAVYRGISGHDSEDRGQRNGESKNQSNNEAAQLILPL